MGYDLNRIQEEVDEELKCGICRQLLETPVILSKCDHIFCGKCLNNWLSTNLICPIDRRSVTQAHIESAPKLFQNFVTKYEICCDFVENGCKTVVRVDKLEQHVSTCRFNPKDRQEIEINATEETMRLESIESRVKSLENENQLIWKQLDEFKKLFGWQIRRSEESNSCSGKLLVKIDEKTLVIDANPKELIRLIKQRVQQLVAISADELIVFFANQELDENRTLSDYRIHKLSNPLFVSMVRKKIKISVKIDNEKEYLIEVSPKDSVADILPKILRKEVLELNQTIATYRNQQMDERRSLFSYRIRDGNYIFVNSRPRFGQ